MAIQYLEDLTAWIYDATGPATSTSPCTFDSFLKNMRDDNAAATNGLLKIKPQSRRFGGTGRDQTESLFPTRETPKWSIVDGKEITGSVSRQNRPSRS